MKIKKSEQLDQSQYITFDSNAKEKRIKSKNQSNAGLLESGIEYPDYGSNQKRRETDHNNNVSVASIIGPFGWFQMLVLIFSGARECIVAYDALIGSIILQPESNFVCDNITRTSHDKFLHNFESDFGVKVKRSGMFHRVINHDRVNNTKDNQCFLPNSEKACESWIFEDHGYRASSLVVQWSLVCNRSWYIPLIESSFFIGMVFGNIVWGICGDKIGRKKAYVISHSIAMVSGWLTILMPTAELFAIARFMSAFGVIGYNILYSIQMEIIATEYRSYATMFNHFGWGLGAISVPFVAKSFNTPTWILALTPLISTIMFPFVFWLPESSRWLILQDRFAEARRVLIRIARFNGRTIDQNTEQMIEKLINVHAIKVASSQEQQQLDQNSKSMGGLVVVKGTSPLNTSIVVLPSELKPDRNKDKKSCATYGIFDAYKAIIANKVIFRDTVIVCYCSFVGHLFYYLQTTNFAYLKNLSFEANFISTGAGDWCILFVGALMLKFFRRRTCMSICMLVLTISFVFQSLLDSNLLPEWNTQVIVTTNNAVGTLAALLQIFVVLIVNQEIYPTVIRQTGSSIGNTIGEIGSSIAPWLIHLNSLIGAGPADLFSASMCFAGMIVVLFLTKTDGIELADEIE